MQIRLIVVLLIGVLVVHVTKTRVVRAQEGTFSFSCEVFGPGITESDLRARFGDGNVRTAPVPWGGAEGDYNDGTALFDGMPDAKLEIYWRDAASKRVPQWVSIRGKQSRWHTPRGITLGTDLITVEKLNGRPFGLVGFGSDAQGTVMSWSGGSLDSQDANGCRVRMRLGPRNRENIDPATSRLINLLKREKEFSSGHPAMQELNPTVQELFIQYAPRAG